MLNGQKRQKGFYVDKGDPPDAIGDCKYTTGDDPPDAIGDPQML